MSRGRGRGRGGDGGNRREISALQTELLGKSIFSKNGDKHLGFPEYEVNAGRAASEEEKHVSELMEEFRNQLQSSVFYLQPPVAVRDIERFSDRFFKQAPQQSLKGLRTNVKLFPEELQSVVLKKRTKRTKAAVDNGDGLLNAINNARDDDEEDRDGKSGSDDDKSGKEEDDEAVDGEEEEDDEEDGNDYIDSYFDNGEEDDIGEIDEDDGGGGGGGGDYY
ncbi:hypothetical protein GGI04_001715 [Coemansia thaxteri]|uniref:DNA-directed RNA polymerase III subunit n=1 Tax=Coemansia thaxteri TaxID=2663907 RepID=A0A9W8BJX5_9FUNG|nr:hypothetical protein H4R26_002845 [Coemansia thaxteri]KAJ2006895.1 hypothetical protein GGI04_001715 [Coemansia thaxteri]KAJ2464563.1 hypothetical protein EV174_006793 [Coemansia sp. RSA 2320]KAJ2472254.1 hypothetical protein GGI02_001713 [Coemansia sp. RSA 2322]